MHGWKHFFLTILPWSCASLMPIRRSPVLPPSAFSGLWNLGYGFKRVFFLVLPVSVPLHVTLLTLWCYYFLHFPSIPFLFFNQSPPSSSLQGIILVRRVINKSPSVMAPPSLLFFPEVFFSNSERKRKGRWMLLEKGFICIFYCTTLCCWIITLVTWVSGCLVQFAFSIKHFCKNESGAWG